jgi:hypothetical protein
MSSHPASIAISEPTPFAAASPLPELSLKQNSSERLQFIKRKSLNNARIYIHFDGVTLGDLPWPVAATDPVAVPTIGDGEFARLGRLISTAGNIV